MWYRWEKQIYGFSDLSERICECAMWCIRIRQHSQFKSCISWKTFYQWSYSFPPQRDMIITACSFLHETILSPLIPFHLFLFLYFAFSVLILKLNVLLNFLTPPFTPSSLNLTIIIIIIILIIVFLLWYIYPSLVNVSKNSCEFYYLISKCFVWFYYTTLYL